MMSYLPIRKTLLPILSGIMLTLAFPPVNMHWIAWISILPLLKSIENEDMSTAFRMGVIAGVAHYLTLVYWIINVLTTYGGLNIIISVSILMLLCIYLSIYTGVFAALASKLNGSFFMVITVAGVWTGLEYLRSLLLTGFPWCLLGYSQYSNLSLIQISDLTGVYGLSFLIVCVNVTAFLLFFRHSGYRRAKPLSVGLALSLILMTSTILYGNRRLAEFDTDSGKERHINVAVIQGNIDQSLKWDPEFQQETIEKYMSITESSFYSKPDIIVWPETSVPFFFDESSSQSQQIFEIPLESGAHFIFGTPAYTRNEGRIDYFNRALWVSPEGFIAGKYDKTHLVPFGEYVPLKRFLPFVNRLVPAAGDFTPGKSVTPLELPGMPSGVLICYEAIFPDISREHVKKGATLLINITNDAWFGRSGAPYQHLYMSLFRAVENRRPLIRAANTGFSALIDPGGKILLMGDLFTEELLTGIIKTSDDSITFYSQYGDIFVYFIILLCLIKFLHELFKTFFNKISAGR